MRLANKIVLATLNKGKYEEFKAILGSYPEIELVPAESIVRNAEKLAFVETYDTYFENCATKARLANTACHYPSLADDTGLEVDALGGKPGVRTARYAIAPKGSAPLSNTEQQRANVEFLLSELSRTPGAPRTAHFVTTLCLCVEGILIHAKGTLEGTIADRPRGSNGFGYDPIFIPQGSDRTLAEMSDEEKNAISHRAKAVHELMAQIKVRGIVFAKP